MRDTAVEEVDHVERPVLAITNDYAPGAVLRHRHRRAQLLAAASGVIDVRTDDGAWTVPVGRAVLIPAGAGHTVRMDRVRTRSLYVEPVSAGWWPARCRVVELSPLVSALLDEAVGMPARYEPGGRDGALVTLLLHELAREGPLPFDVPLPPIGPLRSLCERVVADPALLPVGAWAGELHVSARTLHRRFRDATGLAPAQWQRRACVARATHLLGDGRPVSEVARRLGYATPAAFSTMFASETGAPPSTFAATRLTNAAAGAFDPR